MTILAIDPGKRIGYAIFENDGAEVERGVIQFDDWFSPVISNRPLVLSSDYSGDLYLLFKGDYDDIDKLIVEGFTHDPTIKQGGSEHWASQVVGSVKTFGQQTETPVYVQPASVLSVAMMITGYEKPVTKTGNKKHLPDEDSAWLHGRYWLHANEIL